jgi:hypothetical protein
MTRPSRLPAGIRLPCEWGVRYSDGYISLVNIAHTAKPLTSFEGACVMKPKLLEYADPCASMLGAGNHRNQWSNVERRCGLHRHRAHGIF